MTNLLCLFLLFVLKGAFVRAIVAEYAFTQCGCQDGIFPDVLQSEVFEAFTVLPAQDGAVSCNSGEFPPAPGVTGIDEEVDSISLNLPFDFFNDGVNILPFIFVISADVQNVAESQNGLDLAIFEGDDIKVTLRSNQFEMTDNGNLVSENNAGLGTLQNEVFFAGGVNDVSTFFCVGQNPEAIVCQKRDNRAAFVDIDENNVLNMLSLTGPNTPDVTLKRLRFENDLDLVNFENTAREVAGRMGRTGTIPAVDQLEFITVINTTINIDIFNDGLVDAEDGLEIRTFESEFEGFATDVTIGEDGVITVLPNPEFDVDGIFSETFEVTIGFSADGCEITQEFTLTTEANTLPVIQNDLVVEAFAGARIPVNGLDGFVTDVDFDGDILPIGVFNITGSDDEVTFFDLVDEECQDTPVTEFTIVDSSLSLCVEAAESFFEGERTIEFTVRDLQTGEVSGELRVLSQAPVVPIFLDDITINENTAIPIVAEQLGQNVIDAINGDFAIKITELPDPATGNLSVIRNDIPEPLTVGSEVEKDESVIFTPATGAFNALVGQPAGDDGREILDCEPNEQDANGVCLFGYKYRVVLGLLESQEEGTLSFVVNAVNNLGAAVNFDQKQVLVNAFNGDAATEVNLPEVELSSDNDESVFSVALKITAAGGANFKFDINDFGDIQDDLNIIAEGPFIDTNGNAAEDCVFTKCLEGTLAATVDALQELLGIIEIEINLQEQNLNPSIALDFGGDDDNVLYVVNLEDRPFFDSLANVAIVAGSGVGVIVLLLGLTFFRLRSRDNKLAEKRILQAEKKVQDEIARGKIRAPPGDGKDKKGDKKKGSEAAPDSNNDDSAPEDIGQGWEKHYDPSSGDYFYYNTKTDETTWDVPNI